MSGMIDLWGVFANALWVLGLAVLLAVWSYASYSASLSQQKVREKFDILGYALALDVGLLLFITGLAATEDRGWARVLWILLGIGILVDAGVRIGARRQKASLSSETEKTQKSP